mgnify:CR=1 FL=1
MLGNDYSQMSLGRGRGSFAEFSSVRNVLKNFNYQPQNDTSNSSLSSSSGPPQSTYVEEASTYNHSMNMSRTSPDTVYSTYSPPHSSTDYRATGSSRNSDASSTKTYYWQGSLRSSIGSQSTYGLPLSNDGLPKYQPQQYTDPWGSSDSTSTWDPPSLASNTISPKMLTLNVSSASLSSSGTSQDSMLALSESSAAMTVDDPGEAAPEHLHVMEPQPIPRPRQTLPDCIPSSRRIVPVVPSNDFPPSRNAQKRQMKVAKVPSYTRRRSSPPARSIPATLQSPGHSPIPSPGPRISEACSPRSVLTPQRIASKPVRPATSPRTVSDAQALRGREARDEFLVNSKLAGMSYKDIRRQGNFTEAESTLRGRFRTLTKDKKQRVRNPEWEDNDVSLECLANNLHH